MLMGELITFPESRADGRSWFCPAYAVVRPDTISEIEYIRQVRAGIIPWQSRRSIKSDLTKCQEEWTTRNMLLLAELFALPPDPLEPIEGQGETSI